MQVSNSQYLVFSDHPKEECGVIGIFAPNEDVARMTFFGLYALQHPDSGDVRLCGHHSHVYAPTLAAQGFTTTDADHYALAVPAT